MKDYMMDIGLEVHVELATQTKIFCGCSTKFGASPNTQSCPVCMGMPGALPVLNKKCVELAMAVGLATNCNINKVNKFDRKNYYYPDNPQNYQITQMYKPICTDGYVMVEADGQSKKIGIHEIHLEEDAGKLLHDDERNLSLIDYNRAGVPLIEIVTEPHMSSGQEVISFLEKLRLIIQYLKASDCKLNEGSMRVDVNLSVRKVGNEELGTRTEMKNLNSFKAIMRAIENEAARQIEILENGGEIYMETRRWDDNAGVSYVMRSKEEAKDYRYFPEPDLVPVHISEEWLAKVRKSLPELRDEKRERYVKDYGIPQYDANMITLSTKMADIFEETVKICGKPKNVSNWLITETMRLLKEKELEPDDISFSPENLAMLVNISDEGLINSTVAKAVFEKIFEEDINPEKYIEENGLKQDNNEDAIKEIVLNVIEKNPQSVSDYRNGKDKAIGFLVGQVMKESKGKANPGIVNKLLKEML